MDCRYGYYDENEKYRPHLMCNLNKKMCPYVKLCLNVDRFIQIENFREEECYIMAEYKKKNIPSGSNYVRFSKISGGVDYLYIEVDDQVIRVKNTLGDKVKDYVYLKGEEISLEPFKIKTIIKEVKSSQTEKDKESDK